MRTKLWSTISLAIVVTVLFSLPILLADTPAPDTAKSDAAAKPAEPGNDAEPTADVSLRQAQIATKYEQLEALLLKLSEFEADQNPKRARLLEQAFAQSKDRYTKKQLETIIRQLTTGEYSNALKNQEIVAKDFLDLLELLKSEDRSERIKSEQQRIKEYIKEIERLIRIQKGLRGQNEGGVDPERLADAQGRAADRTKDVADGIQRNEEGSNGKGDNEGSNKGDNEGKNKGDSEGNSKGDSEGNSKGDSEGNSKGDSEGNSKGDSEGKSKGDSEGKSKGDSEGKSKGDSEGNSKGDSEGKSKGDSEGKSKGDSEGNSKGDSEGNSKGDSEGNSKGDSEGNSKGDSEGNSKGDSEGNSKGDSEGNSKGDSEGNSKGDSEGNSKGDSEGNSKGDSQGDSKGDSNGDSKGDTEMTPIRKRIQAAEEKMRDAQRKLEEAKRKESIEAQKQAEEELAKAKAELEEILRQLREEEVERMLAMLEGRFRKMLERELRVYERTKQLDNILVNQPGEEIQDELRVESGKVGIEQHKIAIEADKALILLREEGSSIAFPESVEQMRDDMEQVAQRLNRTNVGKITQELEEEIIETLDYIIAALVKAQQDMEEQPPQPPQPPQPGQPQDQPLVDEIAELKLIKGLQERINNRHKRYARLLDDPDDPVGLTDDMDIRQALERLAERQKNIQQITRDIVLGKNK